MVEERASPSAGWREIYDEMGVDGCQHEESDEAARERCPECGLVIGRDEHRCPLTDSNEASEDIEVFPFLGAGDDD